MLPVETKKLADNSVESGKFKYHKVAKGETLYRLAKAYNISVTDLTELNNLQKNAQLKRGQRIKIKQVL